MFHVSTAMGKDRSGAENYLLRASPNGEIFANLTTCIDCVTQANNCS
jgi:hypothetical protein